MAAMKLFNDAQVTFCSSRSFMDRDMPVQDRVKFSFLLNLKKLLKEWEFQNTNFEDNSGTISMAGLPVLRVDTDGLAFKLAWQADEWGQWKELTKDPKFIELVKVAEEKLQKSSQSKGRGKVGAA